jgi:site-specific recombinase XerD
VLKNYLKDNNVTIETILNLPVKDSERLLINYIQTLKANNKSHSSLNLVFCAVKHLYIMNDIRINKDKIGKFLGESGKKNTDRGYTHEEIKKLLDVADLRMKSVVLLMASTGIRIGAIPDLQLKHLQKTNEKGLYKITVYERSKEEYHTFCSYECYSVINAYLEFRKKSGEILNKESYLVREQFDINDFEQIRKKSRKISVATIKNSVNVLLRKAGLRELNQLRSISQI